MKWIKLLRIDDCALLQSETDTQYVVVSGYDPTQPEDQQWASGTYFEYWNDVKRKADCLQSALNYFRSITEKEKKNATLYISNSGKFEVDIMQQRVGFTKNGWKGYLKSLAQNLQDLYEELLQTEEFGGGTAELYALGDVVDMLQAIDVKVKGDK